ncbi:MAG: alpha/beta hydrolase [Acidimicrobiales bacterium]
MASLPRPSPVVAGFLVAGVVIILAVAGLWSFQRRLIYFPGDDVPPVGDVLPGWSEVTLTTADGHELGAWYAPPPADPAAPVVVVLPGNAGTRANRTRLGSRLAAHGLGVLLVDYRGYAGNPGAPSETGLAIDARAATRFVAERAPDHPVVLFGESLGAAVAIEVAVDDPPAALVLRSPFTSLADVARAHYPPGPPPFLLRDRYPSAERIGSVAAPVLVIVGSDDSIVPPAQSSALHDLAREPKELVVVPGADHNDVELVAGDAVVAATVRFIDREAG